MLSPDFSTLWNYRREILSHLLANEEPLKNSPKDKYELLIKELEFLVKSIMKSPKSYTLWFHRQWVIEIGLKVEREIMQAQEKREWRSRILETELKLCDKMLMMDERNFHCWNYRLLTALLYLKEIPLRLPSGDDHTLAEIEFLAKECEMAEALIKKSFSNYSAWHYRSKLMPELYERR